MFYVSDIADDVKRVLGGCSDSDMYRRINQSIEILAAEADWDPLLGFVDVCAENKCVVLPREVETVLSVNICGRPSHGHDWLFSFHLNGPGNSTVSSWNWRDCRPVPVFRQPDSVDSDGSRLVAQVEGSQDSGKSLRVFGYARGGGWIRTLENGEWKDGFLVPLQYGASNYNPNAPYCTRIERVEKAATVGRVRLYAQPRDGSTQYRIADYAGHETLPQYRMLEIGGISAGNCVGVRVAFRKAVTEVSSLSDLIPLHSKYALVLMAKALRKFDEDRLEEGQAYRSMAIDLLKKKQLSISPPVASGFQVSDGNLLVDRSDRMT